MGNDRDLDFGNLWSWSSALTWIPSNVWLMLTGLQWHIKTCVAGSQTAAAPQKSAPSPPTTYVMVGKWHLSGSQFTHLRNGHNPENAWKHCVNCLCCCYCHYHLSSEAWNSANLKKHGHCSHTCPSFMISTVRFVLSEEQVWRLPLTVLGLRTNYGVAH